MALKITSRQAWWQVGAISDMVTTDH